MTAIVCLIKSLLTYLYSAIRVRSTAASVCFLWYGYAWFPRLLHSACRLPVFRRLLQTCHTMVHYRPVARQARGSGQLLKHVQQHPSNNESRRRRRHCLSRNEWTNEDDGDGRISCIPNEISSTCVVIFIYRAGSCRIRASYSSAVARGTATCRLSNAGIWGITTTE